MRTDFGPDRLRFAELIPERVQKSQYNIGFQPTIYRRLKATQAFSMKLSTFYVQFYVRCYINRRQRFHQRRNQ